MATARPFAYNPSRTLIPGTQQIGDLAVGIPDAGFGATLVEWWNGPDEELGYVIAVPVSGGNQPTPVIEQLHLQIMNLLIYLNLYQTNTVHHKHFHQQQMPVYG
jgi:hypothetical protein